MRVGTNSPNLNASNIHDLSIACGQEEVCQSTIVLELLKENVGGNILHQGQPLLVREIGALSAKLDASF